MNKSAAIVLIFVFCISVIAPAYCDDAGKKLGRGLCNMLTFPFEVPEQIQRVGQTDGPMAGLTFGVLKGLGMMTLRALVGVYEVATFPLPFPKEYKPILTDPEFFFEEKSW